MTPTKTKNFNHYAVQPRHWSAENGGPYHEIRTEPTMKPTFTHGATHSFQAPENWDPAFGECGDLQVRMEVISEDKNKLVECFSTWKPSAEELLHLNAGGVVEIGLCVLNQPVMRVGVVDPVDARLEPYLPKPTVINEHAHGDDHNGS